MDRATKRLFLLVLGLAVAVAGGAVVLLGDGAPGPGEVGGDTQSVAGVIVAVDGETLGGVAGFTLRKEGGDLLEFAISALENATEFPPGHMLEHQATAAPVVVSYRTSGGIRYATRVDDGGS